MAKINIVDAQIKTAEVELKTISVKGKQITLSVFRQLFEKQIINLESFTFLGIPWGKINYFWRDNGNEENHHHLVWQDGNELRRCIVPKKLGSFEIIMELNLEIKDLKKDIDDHFNERYNDMRSNYDHHEWYKINIPRLERAHQDLTEKIRLIESGEKSYFGCKNKFISDLLKIESDINNSQLEVKKLQKILSEKVNDLLDLEKKLEKLLSAINDLPQLFIAI